MLLPSPGVGRQLLCVPGTCPSLLGSGAVHGAVLAAFGPAAIPNTARRRLRFGAGEGFPSLGHLPVTQPRPQGSALPLWELRDPSQLPGPETWHNLGADSSEAGGQGIPEQRGTARALLPEAAVTGTALPRAAPRRGRRRSSKDTAGTRVPSSFRVSGTCWGGTGLVAGGRELPEGGRKASRVAVTELGVLWCPPQGWGLLLELTVCSGSTSATCLEAAPHVPVLPGLPPPRREAASRWKPHRAPPPPPPRAYWG